MADMAHLMQAPQGPEGVFIIWPWMSATHGTAPLDDYLLADRGYDTQDILDQAKLWDPRHCSTERRI